MRKIHLYLTALAALGLLIGASAALAATDCKAGETCLIVEIPGIGGKVTDPAQYLVGIYRFGLTIGGLMAMGIIVFAGIKRIVSAGNTAAIGDANDMIKNAVLGLVLLLGAFLILNTISPRLTQIQLPQLPRVEPAQKLSALYGEYAAQLDSRFGEIVANQNKFDEAKAERNKVIEEIKKSSPAFQATDNPDITKSAGFANLPPNQKKELAEVNAKYFEASRDTIVLRRDQAVDIFNSQVQVNQVSAKEVERIKNTAQGQNCNSLTGLSYTLCQSWDLAYDYQNLSREAEKNAAAARATANSIQ